MNCYPKVEGGKVSLNLFSGHGAGDHVKLFGSTFPIIPCGSFVSKMTFEAPTGKQAIIFFTRVDEPRRMGSGQTAYLDRTPKLDSDVLLIWQDGDKTIAKENSNMTGAELAMFNSFVCSENKVTVTDTSRKIAYVVDAQRLSKPDSTWIYKTVSGDAVAKYIAKQITLEELDAAAESELAACNELATLREEISKAGRELETQRGKLEEVTNRANDRGDALVRFTTLTGEIFDQPFFANRLVRFVAQFFGSNGALLRGIIASSDKKVDKLVAGIQAVPME